MYSVRAMRTSIEMCVWCQRQRQAHCGVAYRHATHAVLTHRRLALSSSSVRFLRLLRCFGFRAAVVAVAVAASAVVRVGVWEEMPLEEAFAKSSCLTSAGTASPAVADFMAKRTTHQQIRFSPAAVIRQFS